MWERWNQSTKIFEKSTNNGASWTPLGLDASIITQGVLDPARVPAGSLPPNVAYTNIQNTFFETQIISGATLSDLRLTTGGDAIRLLHYLNRFQVYRNAGPLFQVDYAGNIICTADIFEKNRSVALGTWITVPFLAANFGMQSGTGSWTLTSAAVLRNKYCLIGKTLIWSIYVSWFSGGNTVVAAPTHLFIKAPTGITFSDMQIVAPAISISVSRLVPFDISTNPDRLVINKQDGSAFTANPVGIVGTFVIEMA